MRTALFGGSGKEYERMTSSSTKHMNAAICTAADWELRGDIARNYYLS